MMYAPFSTLTGPEQAEQFVADRVAEGSDYLKIFSGRAGRWPSLDLDTITGLTVPAHSRGLVVVAHISSVAGVREVVSAGVDVVAHVPGTASWIRHSLSASLRRGSQSARRWPPSRTSWVNGAGPLWPETRDSPRYWGTHGHGG
jgi:hypothetical protein